MNNVKWTAGDSIILVSYSKFCTNYLFVCFFGAIRDKKSEKCISMYKEYGVFYCRTNMNKPKFKLN